MRSTSPKQCYREYIPLKNELVTILLKEGYTIKNYSVFNFEIAPTETTEFFKHYIEHFLFSETLFGRIKRDIWWNFAKLLPHKSNEIQTKLYHDFVEQNIEKLIKLAHSKKDKPLFVYTHIMIPHEPFYLDEKGNFVMDDEVYSTKNLKQAYVKQLIFTTSLLKKIISTLLSDSSRPKVIILEGDHGFRNYNVDEEKLKPFDNLNCYYFSDGDYSQLYDGISPVNSFRVVLNKYFKSNLPILPDSSINIRKAQNTNLKNLITIRSFLRTSLNQSIR
ncbi:MAG: LTA synthase family protein [Chitinophagales bacterium]|nr:LTA synthase family protein [Chitinophagales bacterium]